MGRLYSTFWSNLSKNFSFGAPIPESLHRLGWNLAWRRGPWVQISPPSVQRDAPAGRKTSKVHGTSSSLLWIKGTLRIHALYIHWLTTLCKWTTIDNMTFMLQQLHRTQEQELIRRWDSERELFLQHRTCRGQRLRPFNEFVISTKHLRYLPTHQTDF